MGKLRLFLGILVSYDDDGTVCIDQQHYILQVLKRLGLASTPGAGPQSPMLTGTAAKLQPDDSAAAGPDVPYKEAVGALFWLARGTRPDVAYAVSQAARFLDKPTCNHWRAVLRVLGYLNRTQSLKLRMGPVGVANRLTLRAYADSDWAGDAETRKSRTGWLLALGGACVAWRSTLQTGYSQSSTEAEYVALADAAKEVLWWRKLFRDMRWPCDPSTPILVDNLGARQLACGRMA